MQTVCLQYELYLEQTTATAILYWVEYDDSKSLPLTYDGRRETRQVMYNIFDN